LAREFLSATKAGSVINQTTVQTSGGGRTSLLSQPIQYLKGVGPKRGELLSKLGIATVKDALYYFPYRYEDRGNIKKIARVSYGSYETVTGTVVSAENVTTPRRRMKIFELTVKDETSYVTGIWFNQPYLSRVFQEGARVILYGLVKPDQYKHYRPVMENPEYELIEEGGEGGDDTVHTGRVVPIYKATAGLSVRQIRTVIKNVVDEYAPKLGEFLPDEMLVKYKIPALPLAVKEAHFPSAEVDVTLLNSKGTRAQKRLIFDEFLLLELGLLAMKKGRTHVSGKVLKGDGVLRREFRERLPFNLTDAQESAVREISRDMERPVRMNRLLQGDVGCGKTVVAMMAVLQAAEAGVQSALMAPTEILAEQHYLNVKKWLTPLGLHVALLTSSIKKKAKDNALRELAEGKAALAVGTHSLIQEGVAFDDLGLVIVDEQHRFGVMQRAGLSGKGGKAGGGGQEGLGPQPDVLVMTATPIPRTLALTVYGDLDFSTIDSLPPGRSPVRTKLFDSSGRAEAYRLMKRELARGARAYVVYPLVEESEKSDLKAAKEGAEKLAEIFKEYPVGLLHGRMKPDEKESVMDDFRSGKIRLLVATTVVEVGVDVPEATVMMIEHAERFGLSQLHQLRGRVGRGGEQSFCILMAERLTENSRERLQAMLKHTSGFDIAEDDLRLRGPGEFFGTKQSGLPEISYGDIIRDYKIIEAARKEASAIIDKDPELKSDTGRALALELKDKWKEKLELIKIS
jgi:ATP-dependent DNA helicase RecG